MVVLRYEVDLEVSKFGRDGEWDCHGGVPL